MKTTLIATAIVVTSGIFIVQRFKLADLKEETARLSAEAAQPTIKHTDRTLPEAEIKKVVSTEQLEFFREAMIDALVSVRDRPNRPIPERVKQLLLAAKDFSAKDIARLIELLREDPRLAEIPANARVGACGEIFSEANPFVWRDYLADHRDLPDWQNLFDLAVSSCLKAGSKRAIKQFEEESARGNRDFATTSIRSAMLMNLAADDPDKMLSMAASPEFTADPDALAHIGGFVVSKLKEPEDHYRFLAALQRATEKNPDLPLWKTVRTDYAGNMARVVTDWPFEQMKMLVDGHFSQEEKWLVAQSASYQGDLVDKSKWADWFLSIDLADWERRNAANPEKMEHPAIKLVQTWSMQDAAAASAWLDKMPPGEMRSKAILNHAWMIADRDPDRAASYLGELPDSKQKKNLVNKIGKAKR